MSVIKNFGALGGSSQTHSVFSSFLTEVCQALQAVTSRPLTLESFTIPNTQPDSACASANKQVIKRRYLDLAPDSQGTRTVKKPSIPQDATNCTAKVLSCQTNKTSKIAFPFLRQ